MKTEDQLAGLKLEQAPHGKIIGVVDSHETLRTVSEAFLKMGIKAIEVFAGTEGINLLESEHDADAQWFLGDMEAEMVQRYLAAVKNGQLVFAAIVEPEIAARAAAAAKTHGASEVVHFGTWVITNYQPKPCRSGLTVPLLPGVLRRWPKPRQGSSSENWPWKARQTPF